MLANLGRDIQFQSKLSIPLKIPNFGRTLQYLQFSSYRRISRHFKKFFFFCPFEKSNPPFSSIFRYIFCCQLNLKLYSYSNNRHRINKCFVKHAAEVKRVAPYLLLYVINLMVSNERPTTLYSKVSYSDINRIRQIPPGSMNR